MTVLRKLLDRFLINPGGVRYSELEKILLYVGFEKVLAKGSHVKFKHSLLDKDLIIPVHGNDCKNFYKIYAAKLIKKIVI